MIAPRIGIDGYNLALAEGTGVATYARNLGRTLHEMGHGIDLLFGLQMPAGAAPELRETLFFSKLGHEHLGPQPALSWKGHVKRALMPPRSRKMLEVPIRGQVLAPNLMTRLPPFERLFTFTNLFRVANRHFRRYRHFLTVTMPDPPPIMHWTYPLPIRLKGAANIYTLHDLVPLRLPQTTLEDKRYYDLLIRSCLKQGDRICTVSETSRNDILSMFPVDPEKVVNTYQGTEFVAGAEDDASLERKLRRLFDLPLRGYFLFFAAIEPKKNLGRLIEAYLSADIDTPLVIVGRQAWKADEELRLLRTSHGRELPAARQIRLLDYLPREMLAMLIQGARAACLPSLYEGFGLPALEAMALGTPVLASNAGALPEVVGTGGFMVDPYDVGAMATALRRLDSEPALRASLVDAGKLQVKKFSTLCYQERLQQLYAPFVAAG